MTSLLRSLAPPVLLVAGAAALFSATTLVVFGLLIDRAGFILRYPVDDERFIQVLAFGKHQSPHVKEGASTIPAPDKPGACPVPTPDEHPLTPDSPFSDCGLLTPDLKKSASPLSDASAPDPSALVPVERKRQRIGAECREAFEHWRRCFPREAGRMSLTQDRRRAIEARLREIAERRQQHLPERSFGVPFGTGVDEIAQHRGRRGRSRQVPLLEALDRPLVQLVGIGGTFRSRSESSRRGDGDEIGRASCRERV